MSGPRDHGGKLDAAIAAYGGTRKTWLDLSTGINPVPYPMPRLSHDAWTALPDEAAFQRLGLTNITTLVADGSRGFPEQAPFDRILVTAAAEDPPGPLLAELRVGGIMVLPVGQSDAVQTLIKVTKGENGFDYEELLPVRFVPLVEGLGQG